MLDLAPGAVINGRYRVIGPLGAGGMARVYEAEHIKMNHAVALKVLSAEWAQVPELVERFEREARAVVQLQSPNVARVYDVDHLEDGTPFLAMELLVGRDLNHELAARGPLPVVEACDYVRQAAQGMSAAHAQGIIHRDLKPENLFLCELGSAAGGRRLVKVLDFGLAKDARRSAPRMTAPDTSFGTPYYMSPEQIRSTASVDARTDVWALGVVLFELLMGVTPYQGDAKSIIAQIMVDPVPPVSRDDVHWEVREIVARALAKNPDHRYSCVEDLAEALAPFAPEEPIAMVLARVSASGLPSLPRESARRVLVQTGGSMPQQGWSSAPTTQRPGLRSPAILGAIAGVAIVSFVGAYVAWERSPAAPAARVAEPLPTPVPVTAVPAAPSPVAPPPPVVTAPAQEVPAAPPAAPEVPPAEPSSPVEPQAVAPPPQPVAPAPARPPAAVARPPRRAPAPPATVTPPPKPKVDPKRL